MFGGCPKFERGKSFYTQQKLAKTTVLDFGEQNTHDISALLGVIEVYIITTLFLPLKCEHHILRAFCSGIYRIHGLISVYAYFQNCKEMCAYYLICA